MSTPRGRSPPRSRQHRPSRSIEDEDGSVLSSRQLEAFGRTVHATATSLIGLPNTADSSIGQHYQNALGDIHRELRRPLMQRTVWQLAKTNPRELVRSTLNTSEIQHRALTHLPDELLRHVPESKASYSLFQGFQASIPEDDGEKKKKKHGRHNSKGQKLLDPSQDLSAPNTPTHQGLESLKKNKRRMDHRLEMMSVRKNMCVSEIREIDSKIANLNTMRKIVLDRLGGLESEEADLEHDILDLENKLEDLQEELEDAAAMASRSPTFGVPASRPSTAEEAAEEADAPGFMSESIYDKLPAQQASPAGTPNSVKKRKSRPNRRISMPVLHEHLEKGSRIRQFQAHTDMITALDFDQPFGTLVTSAMDDTVRVWDLNAGRCIGMLEGHLSSVRCLQVSNNMVATGSMDASIKLWDLSQAEYAPAPTSASLGKSFSQSEDMDEDEEATLLFSDPSDGPHPNPPASSNFSDCEVFTLSAHVAEVTALHMHNNTLVSGSADKTLRQWDLVKGRCVQTLDVLWAAAQAAQTSSLAAPPAQSDGIGGWFQPVSSGAGRIIDHEADFVGAVQVFDAALACGTADGMVRLWDLRSGSVSRSLVGHTGPVTALQFDDVHLITASADRSIRIWDLRTGSLYDAFAYDSPILSMQFDPRHIVSAIGDPVVKVYDKTDGRHWDCGAGVKEGLAGLSEEEVQRLSGGLGGGADRDAAAGIVPSAVERVRIREGYLVEGRRDGVVGVWSC